MLKILSDDSQGFDSILSPYQPVEALGNLAVGTCATVVMDLRARQLELRKGPDSRAPMIAYHIE